MFSSYCCHLWFTDCFCSCQTEGAFIVLLVLVLLVVAVVFHIEEVMAHFMHMTFLPTQAQDPGVLPRTVDAIFKDCVPLGRGFVRKSLRQLADTLYGSRWYTVIVFLLDLQCTWKTR